MKKNKKTNVFKLITLIICCFLHFFICYPNSKNAKLWNFGMQYASTFLRHAVCLCNNHNVGTIYTIFHIFHNIFLIKSYHLSTVITSTYTVV